MSCLLLSLASCSSSSDPAASQAPATSCLKDAMKLTSTNVEPSDAQHTAIFSFDVQNTGTTDFDISKGSAPIYFAFKVVTTDDVVYDSEQILTASTIRAGATASASQYAEYGANKVYKSYSYTLLCK